MNTKLDIFEHTLRNTREWLAEMGAVLGIKDEQVAFGALRASLHAIRDSLSTDDAVSFGAQLPMLIRGLYYEGWHPHRGEPAIPDPSTFMSHVAAEVRAEVDTVRIVRAACAVVAKHVDVHEWERVMRVVPGPLYGSWQTEGERRRSQESWGPP